MEKLSIVILHYNGIEILERCLVPFLETVDKASKSVGKSKPDLSVEVIVVDNGSSDGSVETIRKLKVKNEKLKVIENKENLGFAEGNNVGIKKAIKGGADYVMVLNNDVIVKDAFWFPLVDFIKKHKKVGVVSPKIYFAPGREFHKARYQEKERGKVIWFAGGELDWKNVYAFHRGVDRVDLGQYQKTIETDFVSGCCLLAKSEVWQKAGFFDPKYFLYYEDSDFCLKVRKLGGRVFYFPKAEIWHLNAGSSDCGGSLQDYFITRNRLLFGLRWAPLRTKIALIRESIKTLISGRTWQIIGVKDFYLRKFGKGSWQ
ncbi:MAG: glycosyltransferase family 2 protein [Patescibacteria group bacterium]|nr:glycosyltransferase family 2 protein [Patescibacteria group bacterium]